MRNAEGQVAKEVAELAANEAPARIESDLAHMVLMLHEDLLKAFRALSLHASEYADRLRDEVRLGEPARAVEAYYAEQPLLRVMMAMVQIPLTFSSWVTFQPVTLIFAVPAAMAEASLSLALRETEDLSSSVEA